MVNFVEDVLLLSIRPDGQWVAGGLGPDEAIGAAALFELVADGVVTLAGDRVGDVDAGLLPAQYTGYVGKGEELSTVVAAIGPVAKEVGLDALVRRGVISVERKKLFGIAPTQKITVSDQAPRLAALERLRTIEGTPELVPDNVAVLAGILYATDILPLILERPANECKVLISRLEAATPVGDAASEAIAQAAILPYISVIIPTLFHQF